MLIHEDIDTFKQLIAKVALERGVTEQMVEKDYFLCLILKHLAKKIPYLVFKGGTSLSKCYDII